MNFVYVPEFKLLSAMQIKGKYPVVAWRRILNAITRVILNNLLELQLLTSELSDAVIMNT